MPNNDDNNHLKRKQYKMLSPKFEFCHPWPRCSEVAQRLHRFSQRTNLTTGPQPLGVAPDR